MHLNNGASRRSSIGRSLILPLVAAFTGLVAACAIPLLTPQQNSQYCEIEVQGPSGPPVFVQGTLLDPIAETSAEAFANASLVGLFVLGLVAPPLAFAPVAKGPPRRSPRGTRLRPRETCPSGGTARIRAGAADRRCAGARAGPQVGARRAKG